MCFPLSSQGRSYDPRRYVPYRYAPDLLGVARALLRLRECRRPRGEVQDVFVVVFVVIVFVVVVVVVANVIFW